VTSADAPTIELEAGADALRDTLAAIRCARGGDREGLEAGAGASFSGTEICLYAR